MCSGIGLSVAVVCLAAVLVAGGEPKARDFSLSNIVQDSKIKYVPYTLQLRNSSGYIVCAGTLITDQHVLTAAHCFDHYEPADITVVGGASTKSEAGVQRQIKNLFTHDSYNPTTYHNDVAVLKLESPIETSDEIYIIDFCTKQWPSIPNTLVATVNGWLAEDQDKLQTITMPILSQGDCIKHWEDKGIVGELSSSMVCNVQHESRFPCTHLSGSGVVVHSEVCAIMSGGPGCSDSNYPGVYTNIYQVRDYIERSINL